VAFFESPVLPIMEPAVANSFELATWVDAHDAGVQVPPPVQKVQRYIPVLGMAAGSVAPPVGLVPAKTRYWIVKELPAVALWVMSTVLNPAAPDRPIILT